MLILQQPGVLLSAFWNFGLAPQEKEALRSEVSFQQLKPEISVKIFRNPRSFYLARFNILFIRYILIVFIV